ncbi:hypothetical protein Moror_16796 [Moniliophthora roreri MCA 2997]|uniref:Uncharacterized protein n=1 Tax=Moniliophthora roreri (strain MCA 2997) TaxID=1381753 RepID=V2XAI1_MONRO|nr:hypothetical protein Moror_16796 [Moniliophthora roreri MCA 2997]
MVKLANRSYIFWSERNVSPPSINRSSIPLRRYAFCDRDAQCRYCTCFGFFSKTGAGSLDLDILQYANAHSCETTTEDLLGVQDLGIQFSWKEFIPNGPLLCSSPDRIPCDEVRDSIGSICLDTVYSGLGKIALLKRGIADSWRKFTSGNAVCNMTRIEGGWTRFQFDTKVFGWTGDSLLLSIDGDRVAWLSQAHRFSEVFTGGSDCFVPHLAIYLYIGPRLGQSGVSAPETPPIVYLFIRPSPHHVRVTDLESWINQIAFWSFDENGTTEISEAECESLYLPNITVDCVEVKIRKWPKSVYDAIYMWQVARGFDPTVVKQNTRSEEIEVVEQMEPSTAPDLFVMPDSTSDKNLPLLRLVRGGIPQSDISAFAYLVHLSLRLLCVVWRCLWQLASENGVHVCGQNVLSSDSL